MEFLIDVTLLQPLLERVLSIAMDNEHTRFKNALNFLLMLAVCIPAVGVTRWSFMSCSALENENIICTLAIQRPLIYANAVFFINVCCLFWIISLIQNSTWLIGKNFDPRYLQVKCLSFSDPYWTFVPPLLAAYYALHPHAVKNARVVLTVVLILIWSIRSFFETNAIVFKLYWNYCID